MSGHAQPVGPGPVRPGLIHDRLADVEKNRSNRIHSPPPMTGHLAQPSDHSSPPERGPAAVSGGSPSLRPASPQAVSPCAPFLCRFTSTSRLTWGSETAPGSLGALLRRGPLRSERATLTALGSSKP